MHDGKNWIRYKPKQMVVSLLIFFLSQGFFFIHTLGSLGFNSIIQEARYFCF